MSILFGTRLPPLPPPNIYIVALVASTFAIPTFDPSASQHSVLNAVVIEICNNRNLGNWIASCRRVFHVFLEYSAGNRVDKEGYPDDFE